MDVKPINKKPIVVFEVSNEKNYTDSNLFDKFNDFIQSLGFDVKGGVSFSYSQTISIDGVTMYVLYHKSSTMAKNAYDKEPKPRKDRCIEIRKYNYKHSELITKIKFNVDLDRNRIVKSINKFIKEQKYSEQYLLDKKKNDAIELERMRVHYYSNPVIAELVKYIYLRDSIVYMHIDIGAVKVDVETGWFIEFVPNRIDSMTYDDVFRWEKTAKTSCEVVMSICIELKKLGAVGGGFPAYAKTASERVELNK